MYAGCETGRDDSAALCVCVPARDEAQRLPRLFAALAAQDGAAGAWTLCLVLDTCVDDSAGVAARLARDAPFPVVVAAEACGAPSAGWARGAAMRLGLARSGEGGLLLTTDADSAPAPDWIGAARRALAGCDLATGRIVRRARDGAVQDRLEAYYDRLYALRRRIDPLPWEPAPLHHFTGGANMAFRAGAYARLGGFAPLPSGEDALIVDEAHRAGLRVRRDARIVVHTSSRRQGRAPGGLATWLGRDLRADEVRVSHPAGEAWRYEMHALARDAFHAAASAAALAHRLGLTAGQLAAVARACPNAESFATRVVPEPPGAATVTLPEAEAALGALAQAPQGCAA